MCFYWAPIAAFMMLVVTPRRRATAQGLSLLASHLFGDAASPVIVGQVVDMILAGHNCCEGCEKCPCVPTSNGSGSWDDSCALPNCAWANATVGMASGCTNSNGAEVSGDPSHCVWGVERRGEFSPLGSLAGCFLALGSGL